MQKSSSDFEVIQRGIVKMVDEDGYLFEKGDSKLRYLRAANVRDANLSSNNTECDTREVEFQGFAREKAKLLPTMRKQLGSPQPKQELGKAAKRG